MRQSPVSVLLFALAISAAASAAAGSDDGHDQIDGLIERVEASVAETGNSRDHLEKMLETYHTMLGGKSTDRRAEYKALVTDIEQHEKQTMELRKRFEELSAEAAAFFKEWQRCLGGIKGDHLRRLSEGRLTETKERTAQLLGEGEKTVGRFEPIVTSLSDQLIYLGHDLNTTAAESLENEAGKLDSLASELYEQIEAYASQAGSYVGSLKPN
jgi:hypothetical protein